MRSRLVVVTAIAALLAAPLHAQDPFQLTFGLSEATERSVLVTVRMRNTQGYGAPAVYSLLGAVIKFGGFGWGFDGTPPFSPGCDFTCDAFVGPENAHWDGPVKTGSFQMGYIPNTPTIVTVNYGPSPFVDAIGGVNSNRERYAFVLDLDAIPGGGVSWGIIGCTTPQAYFHTGSSYAGQNCLTDGFDGWWQFDVRYTITESAIPSGVDMRTVTTSDFQIAGYGGYTAVVPEPSTYALTIVGLVGLGIIAGRSRSATRHAGEPKA